MRSDSAPVSELAESPDGGVERGEDADLADGQAGGGEQDREQAPGQAVVEVVDHAGLAGRGQRRLAKAGLDEDLPVGELGVEVVVAAVDAGCMGPRLEAGVAAGLAHDEGGQAEAERGVGDRRGRTARDAARSGRR